MSYIGIDKGGTRHTLALADASGAVLLKAQYVTDRWGGAEEEISVLRAEIGRLIANADDTVEAIGISFGGLVEPKTGTTVLSHQVSGWEGVPLAARFLEWFGIPTAVENDANVGALGEWRFGAGVGCMDMLYVNIGSGIGGGIIASGKLLGGHRNLAGEIGHITIDPAGPVCTCGRRGCLEALASGPGLEQRYAARVKPSVPVAGREIFRRAGEGDATVMAVIAETADYLAHGIGIAATLLSPERIVVGGGLSEAGPLLFDPLNAALPNYLLPQLAQLQAIPALLGYDAGVRGAIALAMGK